MPVPPDYDPTEFQEVLTDWLRRTGLSQSQAGYTIRVSPGIINRWLKPRGDDYLVQPTLKTLEKLQPHIGLPIEELRRMTGNLNPEAQAAANRKPRTDHRLSALQTDLAATWPEMDEQERGAIEATARALLGQHHNRKRLSRKTVKEITGKDPGDTGSRGHLTNHWAA